MKMPRLVNAYSIAPDDIQPGDEMVFVIKAMVMHRAPDGKLLYRLYRCAWDGDIEDMPQGDRLLDDSGDVCQEVFPSLAMVGRPG